MLELLYFSMDILYNPKDNVLTLTRSGLVDKEIKLNEGSLIESIVDSYNSFGGVNLSEINSYPNSETVVSVLKDFSLPADEVYINLEQNRDGIVLMETTIAEGTFPQCMAVSSEFGGELIHFLPGHKYASAPECVANISAIILKMLNK